MQILGCRIREQDLQECLLRKRHLVNYLCLSTSHQPRRIPGPASILYFRYHKLIDLYSMSHTSLRPPLVRRKISLALKVEGSFLCKLRHSLLSTVTYSWLQTSVPCNGHKQPGAALKKARFIDRI